MPKILLSHGGGGTFTKELIENVVLSAFRNDTLETLDDAACLRVAGKDLVFTTDSYVVDPLFFPGGDIGKLAVCGTANDLAMQGGEPKWMSLSLILEEGLEFDKLERVVRSMAETLDEVGVPIVAADTKVVERGRAERLYISMAGIGRIEVSPAPSMSRIEPGDVLIINGPIGLHGLAVMLERQGMEFEGRIESDVAPLWSLIESVLSPEIKFMRDPTRGGLAMTLNEIADKTGLGVEIDESKIPLTPEVEMVSELLGIEPIEIANEGKVLMVVAREAADRIVESLRRHPLGRDAAMIGEITESHPGKVVMITKLGTTKIITKPVGEALPRIC